MANRSEVRQFDDTKERRSIVDLAEFYSIIKATEALERAFSNGAVQADAYEEACRQLIMNFKDTEKAMGLNTQEFFQNYRVDCPRAYDRLLVTGVPATVLHASSSGSKRNDQLTVAQTVADIITAKDCLALGQTAVDEIQPMIANLTGSLNKVSTLPKDFEGLVKMRNWLQKLNDMRAADNIDEDEVRQLQLDLENTHSSFCQHLGQD